MSWLVSKRKKREAEEEASSSKLLNDKKVKWVKEASQLDLIAKFNAFHLNLKGTFREVSLEGSELDSFLKVLDAMNQIRTLWFRIDRNCLSYDEGVLMFDIVNTGIPQSISNFQFNVIRYNTVEDAWSGFYGSMYDFSAIVKSLTLIEREQSAQGFFSTTRTAAEGLDFPIMDDIDGEVSRSLTRLKNLWKQATKGSTSIEDEFFLEQMVESYLPESYQMYNTFMNAPENLQASAQQLFLEQLSLMENRLVSILKIGMEQNLTAMQNQVDFLKQRTETVSSRQDSQLKLPGKVGDN